jgi:hypothetical protein
MQVYRDTLSHISVLYRLGISYPLDDFFKCQNLKEIHVGYGDLVVTLQHWGSTTWPSLKHLIIHGGPWLHEGVVQFLEYNTPDLPYTWCYAYQTNQNVTLNLTISPEFIYKFFNLEFFPKRFENLEKVTFQYDMPYNCFDVKGPGRYLVERMGGENLKYTAEYHMNERDWALLFVEHLRERYYYLKRFRFRRTMPAIIDTASNQLSTSILRMFIEAPTPNNKRDFKHFFQTLLTI